MKQLDPHTAVTVQNLEVYPKFGEPPEKLIKRFMKKVRNEGILQEVFERRHYEKPSVKKRRKAIKARFLQKKCNIEEKF